MMCYPPSCFLVFSTSQFILYDTVHPKVGDIKGTDVMAFMNW